MGFVSNANTLSTVAEVIATGKNGGDTGILVYNTDATITVYIGASDVDATEGVPVLALGSYSADIRASEKVYAVAASGTPVIVVQLNNQ
ncbi:MAG: hypothetical protein V3S26_04210 [Acidimicrobiia bacterium]